MQTLWTRYFAVWMVLGALGCDSRSVAGPGGSPPCVDCMHTQYVLSSLRVPAPGRAQQLGCDLNSDGVTDNALGNVLAGLPTVNVGLDFQRAADQAFAHGELVVLFNLGYKPDLRRTTAAELTVSVGQHDPSDGLSAPDFYNAGGRFTVTGPTWRFGGDVVEGRGDFSAARSAVEIPMPMGQPALSVAVVHGNVTGDLSPARIANGVLCGAIPATELRDRLVPAVADMLSAGIKQGDQTLRRLFDADHSCNADPDCTPGAPAACHCVTAQEVLLSPWIRLLDPDLDLDPALDNPFATRPDDATRHNDALSFGVGFEAHGAQVAGPR